MSKTTIPDGHLVIDDEQIDGLISVLQDLKQDSAAG